MAGIVKPIIVEIVKIIAEESPKLIMGESSNEWRRKRRKRSNGFGKARSGFGAAYCRAEFD